mgnify:CR=1 FL=1
MLAKIFFHKISISMKIQFPQLRTYSFNKQNKTNSSTTNVSSIENRMKPQDLLPSKYYTSFLGGDSLNLSKTFLNLKKMNATFPSDVEELVQQEIQSGNKDNKTLVDIHKEKYKSLNDCNTLEELKFFYPEFADVTSSFDSGLNYSKNSFIDKFFKGELKDKNGQNILNPEKDLAVQLIQMYWGDCLSLNDLEKVFNSPAVGTFRKLNIPVLNPKYAHYMKLSDKEANEMIVNAMKRNRSTNVNEKVIKRIGKPLSAEHKEKISKSLIEYYKQNPDVSKVKSEKDREYFEKNPIQSAIFTQVLLRAWDCPEAKSIKKQMSKFMSKEMKPEDIVEEYNKKNSKLGAFWEKNKWASASWSKAMEKSWKRQKELLSFGIIKEPISMVHYIPPILAQIIANGTGMDADLIEKIAFTASFDYKKGEEGLIRTQEVPACAEINKRRNEYFEKNPDLALKWSLSLEFSINALLERFIDRNETQKAKQTAKCIHKLINKNDGGSLFFALAKGISLSKEDAAFLEKSIESNFKKLYKMDSVNDDVCEFQNNIRRNLQKIDMLD